MKIILEKGQRVFFTSDTHYNHANICKATSQWPDSSSVRDYNSLYHMNAVLIDSINQIVREDDILFHLGDWSFGGFDSIAEFRNQINCKNVHLILGNHDHHIENDKEGIRSLFASVNHYLFLTIVQPTGGKHIKHRFVLCHFPIASWNGMGDGVMHLHGHVHLSEHSRVAKGRAMDVGVDGNDLNPNSLEEVLDLLKDRPKCALSLPKDHHENI